MAPTQVNMARAAAGPTRLAHASAAPPPSAAQTTAFAQVNATGLPFWQLGAPQCKDTNVRVYPDVED